MLTKREQSLSIICFSSIFLAIVAYYAFIQFVSPVLYGFDGYYHISISRTIRDLGPRYDFPWAQFSTFRDHFSDKGFLFHLITVPFVYLTDNIILAAKWGVIFYNVLFLSVCAFILRKYLPLFLTGIVLLFFIASEYFSVHFTLLRPLTLANILTISGIYFLIKKNRVGVFTVSLLYSLSHISFFTMIIFAGISELSRYIMKKEWSAANILYVFLGIIIGSFFHPNSPYNWISFHLNAVLVPFYSLADIPIGLGRGLLAASSKMVLMGNIALFISLFAIVGIVFIKNVLLSFDTVVWWVCFSFYFLLGFVGSRYWYPGHVLFVVFAASFVRDWIGRRDIHQIIPQLRIGVIALAVLLVLSFTYTVGKVGIHIKRFAFSNAQYEDAALWMKDNIPKAETVYHADWHEAVYFIALNPKNNYLVMLDPIYMFYPYPEKYMIYKALASGRIADPAKAIKESFGVSYGYVNKKRPLYAQIRKNDDFEILYENKLGVVFKLKGGL